MRRKPYLIFEGVRDCRCVRERDVVAQLDRTWRGLSKAAAITRSPLAKWLGADLWIRADVSSLRVHLAGALRDNPRYLPSTGLVGSSVRVVTDADLLNAQFSWKKGDDDDDGPAESDEVANIRPVDLYGPPALLVLVLGVQDRVDKVLPGLVSTALRERENRSKPTWIVDGTTAPLDHTHLAYSRNLEFEVASWRKVLIESSGAAEVAEFPAAAGMPAAARTETRIEVFAPSRSASAQPAAPVEIDPIVRAEFAVIGVQGPKPRRGGGGAAPCVVPGCKGTLTILVGRQTQDLIVGCDNPKCLTTHTVKVKGVEETRRWMRLDRFRNALERAKGQPTDEVLEDEEVRVTSDPGLGTRELPRSVQQALGWLRGQLARGPHLKGNLLEEAKVARISRTSLYEAAKAAGIAASDATWRLPQVATTPISVPGGEEIDDLIRNLNK